jgi:serine/threonine protein kinase
MAVALADIALAPGARVDGRYRLDGMLEGGHSSTLWRGTDELLKRSVAVQVFESPAARSPQVFNAVRQASQLIHGGLAHVFDANDSADPPYLVRELIGGRDLGSVLTNGPLDPWFAAEIFRQASTAIATAHRAGVYHLRLTPRSIVWSKAGRVKIVGVGIDAALTHASVDDPQATDARDLARLLGMSLTGRWSHGDVAIWPTAAQATQAWMARRQGVGRRLASIADRTVNDDDRTIETPSQLAAELEHLALRVRAARRRRTTRHR